MSRNELLPVAFLLSMWTLCFQDIHAQLVLPLDSILLRIERNHPALKAPDARIRELNIYAAGTVTLPPPLVSGGFWMAPYNTARWSEGMGSIMVSVQQMLPNRGMQEAEGRYMQSMSGMQQAEKSVMQNLLFAEAKFAWNNWVMLKKKSAALTESERLLQIVIASAKNRYTYNRERLGSIYKAEAQLAELERMQSMFAGEIRQQKNTLRALMLFSTDEFDIDSVLPAIVLPDSIDTTRIYSRSDIRAVEANLRTARLEQEFNRSKLNPEFGVRYDHMFAFGGAPWQFSLMGMVTVPIAPWANRDIKSRIEGIDSRIAAFEWEKRAIANTVRGELENQIVMMRTLQDQLDRYETSIVPNQRKRFQSTLIAYEQNTDDLFIVLDAWLELKMSRLAQLDLLQQLLQARTTYEKELEIR